MLKQYLRYGRKRIGKQKIRDETGKVVITRDVMTKGNICGVFIAYTGISNIEIGYSKWNRKLDVYNHESMINIAEDRAAKFSILKNDKFPKIPISIKYDLYWFIKRCKCYFKELQLPEWAEVYLVSIDNKYYYNWKGKIIFPSDIFLSNKIH